MIILDTNILLRYMLDDIPALAEEAQRLIENNEIYIPTEIIAELVYVLTSVYKIDRGQAIRMISNLLDNPNTHTSDDNLLRCAFSCFTEYVLDFVDCLIIGYHKVNGFDVKTFDKKLNKVIYKADHEAT